MEFKDRLKSYREELNIKTHTEMAPKLGISRSLYGMLENGTRNPSKEVLDALVELSGNREEYWIYGVTSDDELVKLREEFKCLKMAIDRLEGTNALDLGQNGEWSPDIERLLLSALKADIIHIQLKEKQGN